MKSQAHVAQRSPPASHSARRRPPTRLRRCPPPASASPRLRRCLAARIAVPARIAVRALASASAPASSPMLASVARVRRRRGLRSPRPNRRAALCSSSPPHAGEAGEPGEQAPGRGRHGGSGGSGARRAWTGSSRRMMRRHAADSRAQEDAARSRADLSKSGAATTLRGCARTSPRSWSPGCHARRADAHRPPRLEARRAAVERQRQEPRARPRGGARALHAHAAHAPRGRPRRAQSPRRDALRARVGRLLARARRQRARRAPTLRGRSRGSLALLLRSEPTLFARRPARIARPPRAHGAHDRERAHASAWTCARCSSRT